MRLPRDIGGEEIARLLGRYGYRVVRRTGSHMRLTHHERVWKSDGTRSGGAGTVRGAGVPEPVPGSGPLARDKQAVVKAKLGAVAYAPTRAEAERKRQEFEAWCQQHGYGKAAEALRQGWDRMVTFYRYPQEHWRHLRTVNVVESPFAALRLQTDAAKRFKKVERATAVIWKMLMVAQTRFRRLMAKVYVGVRYKDGIEVTGKEAAA